MSGPTLRSAAALVEAGLLAPADEVLGAAIAEHYAIAVSTTVSALIERNDPDDPIARQFVPDPRELIGTPGETADPIGDEIHAPVPGLVHRYPDRVLLKLVSVCAVYCRFCFRRESVGSGPAALSQPQVAAALAYIAAHPAIWEVILTGGDPLAASPRRLRLTADGLAAIDHVKILRLHTRIPVVDPDRITAGLIEAIGAANKTVFVAIHANHPRELTAAAQAACARLAAAGFVLVSQSVLLRGVNDDVATLASLMRGFVEAGIKPYYLHHPDHAPGTGHFRLSIAEGQALVAALRGRVSGLCQPHYVLDIPGGFGKSPIGPTYLECGADGATTVRDYQGGTHAYPPRS